MIDNIDKNYMDKLYLFLVENKELDFEEVSKNMYLRFKMSVRDILKLICENKANYMEDRIYQMKLIISYILKRKQGNVSDSLKNEVDKIKLKEIVLPVSLLTYPGFIERKRMEKMKREDSISKTKEILNEVIEKNYVEKKDANKIATLVKANLKSIDDETYLEYLRIRYNLYPILENDLYLIEDIILTEINDLTNKLAMLEYYASINDVEGIKSIEIKNQSYKSEEYQNSVGNIAYSKTRRLNHLIEVLLNLYNRIRDIKEQKDCLNFKKLESNDITYLNANYPVLANVYKNIDNTYKIYKTFVQDINNVVDSRKESISKEFNKKFLLINKEAQE